MSTKQKPKTTLQVISALSRDLSNLTLRCTDGLTCYHIKIAKLQLAVRERLTDKLIDVYLHDK